MRWGKGSLIKRKKSNVTNKGKWHLIQTKGALLKLKRASIRGEGEFISEVGTLRIMWNGNMIKRKRGIYLM